MLNFPTFPNMLLFVFNWWLLCPIFLICVTREDRSWWLQWRKTTAFPNEFVFVRFAHLCQWAPAYSTALLLFLRSRPCHPTLPQFWTEPKLDWKRTKKVFVYTVCIVSGLIRRCWKDAGLRRLSSVFPLCWSWSSPLAPLLRPTAGALDPRQRPQLPITSSSSFNL